MPQLKLDGSTLNWSIAHDGARNCLIDVIGVLDSADIVPTVIVDVGKLYAEGGRKITRLRLDDVEYFVEPGLFVELLWQGESEHMHMFKVTGKGRANYEKVGGRQNSHDEATGNLMLATSGYKEGRMTFSMQLELIKQFT